MTSRKPVLEEQQPVRPRSTGVTKSSMTGPSAKGEIRRSPSALQHNSPPLMMGDDEEGDKEAVIHDEDVEKLRVAPSPQMPSAAEVEEHRITHYPFRSWCKECIEGRALGERRGQNSHGPSERLVTTIGIDYFFMTGKGMMSRSELNGEYPENEQGEAKLEDDRSKGEIVKCVIVRDSMTKAIFAHVVPCKGLDEHLHVVKLVCADIEWMGHVKMILQSDGEPALTAFRDAVRERMSKTDGVSQIAVRASPVGSH